MRNEREMEERGRRGKSKEKWKGTERKVKEDEGRGWERGNTERKMSERGKE